MKPSTSRVVWTGLLRSARRRATMALAGLGAMGAMVWDSWALLALTAAGYCAAITRDMARRSFWREVIGQVRRQPPNLPDVESFLGMDARRFMSRLSDARAARLDIFVNVPDTWRDRVADVLEAIAELEEAALQNIRDLDCQPSDTALSGERRLLADERDRLNAMPEGRLKPAPSEEYEVALAFLEERSAAVDGISRRRAQTVARLEAILGGLEALPWTIRRLGAQQSLPSADFGRLREFMLKTCVWNVDPSAVESP